MKSQIEVNLEQFNILALKQKQGSILQNTSLELVKIFSQNAEKLNESAPSPEKADHLVKLCSTALDPQSTTDEKMSALIAIQDQINQNNLKVFGLEATAAAVKTLEAFVCIAWAGLCVFTLGAFYVGTFPFGLLADLAMATMISTPPPIATFFLIAAVTPFSILDKVIFPAAKKEREHSNKMKLFKEEAQKILPTTPTGREETNSPSEISRYARDNMGYNKT